MPPRILTNADLAKMVDTSDEWIMQRLGIRERHLVEPGMATSDMAVEAARRCLAQRGIQASEVEVVIVATVTPDMFFPATACLVQDKLGAHGAWGFDLSAACSGFLYALQVGAKLVESGVHSKVLVIGADTMSSIIDYTDRTTCVIFGDGAGAVLVEPTEEGEVGLIDFCHEIDGSGAAALNMPAGGSLCPASPETIAARMHYVHQDGQAVYKYAVRKMVETSTKLLNSQQHQCRRSGLLHPSPGEQAHYSFDRRAPGIAAGAGDHQYRSLRKHHRRHHPPGHADGAGRTSAAARKPGAVGFGRGRLYGGRLPASLGNVKRRRLVQARVVPRSTVSLSAS